MRQVGKSNGNGSRAVARVGTLADAHDHGSVVILDPGTYRVDGLVRSSNEEVAVLGDLAEEHRPEQVERWIELGVLVEKRVSAVADGDYLGREVDRLVESVRGSIDGEIRRRFDPAADQSLTKPIVEQTTQVKTVLGELQHHLDEMMKRNFDPNDARSVVARMTALVALADKQIAHRFDPARKDSVVGSIDQTVTTRLGSLEKWMAASDGPFATMKGEIERLRVEIAKQQAVASTQRDMFARSSQKGTAFEDDLEPILSELARAHGDTVERTSKVAGPGGRKCGDFVITLRGGTGRVVIEAKNGKVGSIPKLLTELREARQIRSADHAIAVARDAEYLPRQVGRFQPYDEGVVTSLELLEVALRWVRAELSLRQSDGEVDSAAIEQGLKGLRTSLRRIRPVRAQLRAIEKASEAIASEIQSMEDEIVEASEAIEEALRETTEES